MTDKQVWEIAQEIMDKHKKMFESENAFERRTYQLQQEELQDDLAEEFGRRSGWKRAKTRFSVPALAGRKIHDGGRYNELPEGFGHREGDHPYFYRTADNRAAGVACHLYSIRGEADRDVLRRWAEARGLRAEFPDFPSWWIPEGTTLVVYKPKNGGNENES